MITGGVLWKSGECADKGWCWAPAVQKIILGAGSSLVNMTWGTSLGTFIFQPLYCDSRTPQHSTTPEDNREYGSRKVKEERRAGEQPDERQVRQGKRRGHA